MARYLALLLTLALAAPCAYAAPEPPPPGRKRKPPKKPPKEPEKPDTATGTVPVAPATTAADGGVESAGGAVSAPPSPDAGAAAPGEQTKVEEVVDFEAEEKKLDQRVAKEVGQPAAGAGAAASKGPGFKFILDVLAQYNVGQKSFTFFPNHSLIIIMVEVTERISVQLNIAPDPAFFELAFAVTPKLNVRVGKLLVPFGTNNFHHIIGGRVDQSSKFLPETWSDYGVGMSHLVVDSRSFSLEYELYAVNGFGGTTQPLIGAGTIADNNFAKGLGARVTGTLPHGIRLIGSAYHSLWDANNSRSALFYSAGAVMPVGAVSLPVLNRFGLRAEWSRGELQLPDFNYQQGLTRHAVARAGWYAELTFAMFEELALRVRAGRLNPDNTVSDDDDLEVLEPAVVIGSPKLSFVIAYQFTKVASRRWSPTSPPDVLYAKVFLQY